MTQETDQQLIELTADIVAAYVANNQMDATGLSSIISSVHASLIKLSSGVAEEPPQQQRPAVLIKKSITPDYIVCLEDGKKFKSLKRHLRTAYGMTPEEYRAKWGLPPDYPMVAPNYAAARSHLAKTMGLGQQRRERAEPAPAAPVAPEKPAKTRASSAKASPAKAAAKSTGAVAKRTSAGPRKRAQTDA
ncbi:hypothetical protein GCM10010994_35360 [Chelatococcus reniformis]|uniref:MucR family transcriptional regulator n=1 Tax=Chelatococcus reniformis TaxID=1494448 RepID=A0A916XID9_9HYPH|nr:hypothetical protein GCM10010994_35360 [Chelatococcus reniformis]